MERGAFQIGGRILPDRGKVSQTRLLLQFSSLCFADAVAIGHNIILGCDFN
jgi:hypothetical protein